MAEPKSTLTFITENLPTFFAGIPVNFAVQAAGGVPPYTFAVTQGSLSPLTLSPAGVITGTPSTPGDTTVRVSVSDAGQPPATVNQDFDVQVAPTPEVTL
jgi:5'-nucleotidase